MSRYKCHICEVEHGTENMVAYCAACFDKLRAELAESRKEAEAEKKSAMDAMKACRIWQEEAEALREERDYARAAVTKSAESSAIDRQRWKEADRLSSDRLVIIRGLQAGVRAKDDKITAAESRVRALEDALAQIANIMGGPTMTYSPENEVSEWRGRWQSCAGIVARALSSPAAEAKEKI